MTYSNRNTYIHYYASIQASWFGHTISNIHCATFACIFHANIKNFEFLTLKDVYQFSTKIQIIHTFQIAFFHNANTFQADIYIHIRLIQHWEILPHEQQSIARSPRNQTKAQQLEDSNRG